MPIRFYYQAIFCYNTQNKMPINPIKSVVGAIFFNQFIYLLFDCFVV